MKQEKYISWSPMPDIPRRLICVAMHDDIEGFRIVLRGEDPESPSFQLVFESVVGYRNVNESFRYRTWKDLALKSLPALLMVENSQWISWLVEESEGVLQASSLVHYAIYTLEDCIDVVTEFPPAVRWLNRPAENRSV